MLPNLVELIARPVAALALKLRVPLVAGHERELHIIERHAAAFVVEVLGAVELLTHKPQQVIITLSH